ncbi:hypothetical protein EGK14_05465 [Erwinia sp. 198]|nr:hypothetical protein EGK14_05465 [Erwinia sp. 198]
MIAGRIACGDAVVPKKNLNAAINFKYPEFDMTADGVTLPGPEITRDAQTYCVQLAYPGDKLALPPSGYVARAAYSLSVFNESVEGDRLCRQLLEAVTVTGSPLTEPVLNGKPAFAGRLAKSVFHRRRAGEKPPTKP